MKILVLNSGSSSLKYQLFNMPEKEVICSGLVERIGIEGSRLTYKRKDEKYEEDQFIPDHKKALQKVAALLLHPDQGVIKTAEEIRAVGHRVVHGGSLFTETVEITTPVEEAIAELSGLAPLHNPANLEGVKVARQIFQKARQIAVFDTAFHQTMPAVAYQYAIPVEFLKQHQIRAYGFHGTSHKYVSEKAVSLLPICKKLITIHLGNGCSITAVKDGKSIDHSLGFAPINGLIMGTRCGDIDPSVIFYLSESLNYSIPKIKNLLQKESGMLGLTGYSDLRDIEKEAEAGNESCKLALLMNAYRVKKYIGAYVAVMNGLDAIVFTAGIGENSTLMRSLIIKDMEYLGLKLDIKANEVRSSEIREIHKKDSNVPILIIPTNEELEIATQSYSLIR
ncbi:acetate kinase [Aquimarina sp. ERC-38]|uniref:acetate/propionate family kinase n=1 Tax=Aquimarina sp. ERC-38 TaxID=2949996 RepID=UPI00224550DB|nr:acetate kinase [Aquimarina sp. ERC-38]UZO79889.1 acetate kinase [Aquimarina sp. ERC-38]